MLHACFCWCYYSPCLSSYRQHACCLLLSTYASVFLLLCLLLPYLPLGGQAGPGQGGEVGKVGRRGWKVLLAWFGRGREEPLAAVYLPSYLLPLNCLPACCRLPPLPHHTCLPSSYLPPVDTLSLISNLRAMPSCACLYASPFTPPAPSLFYLPTLSPPPAMPWLPVPSLFPLSPLLPSSPVLSLPPSYLCLLSAYSTAFYSCLLLQHAFLPAYHVHCLPAFVI